ncbi:hypothetical protein BT96DRAFT_159463 [Gymnopus androsaceus JB14]|uniref:DUF6534 domain-containing protein n=1 Tax=Gymnopus androsaceus JB14 TaxID=1447944 RepID=A0A6A4HBK5_9AGAR|nr:hypothetical protein BT96DRAFT_159463 [Gymnopus androsaceus JB14]
MRYIGVPSGLHLLGSGLTHLLSPSFSFTMESTTSKIFTPLFIGTLLNILLLGVTSMQALYYFQTYKRDPIWFRLLVSYLTLAELVNTICDIAIVYEPLILRYGSPVPFTPKFLPADAVITALISTPVQLFMAWRIKKITKSTLLCALTTFASLCSLAGGVWLSISSITDSPFNQSQSSQGPDRTPVIIWLAFSGATDLLIIFIVAGSLMKKRKRYHDASNDPALDSTFNRVIMRNIQTGSVTAFAVLTELVVFLTINGVPYFFIWDLILSKLYTNSLLTS